MGLCPGGVAVALGQLASAGSQQPNKPLLLGRAVNDYSCEPNGSRKKSGLCLVKFPPHNDLKALCAMYKSFITAVILQRS